MRKLVLTAAVAFAFAAIADGAIAGQCRDAKGKFIKCPAAAAPASKHCKDPKTKKFVKCSAAGAVPA